MFGLLIGGLAALNQVATLIGALVCGGLGALLVGNAVYWRLHAVRVQGQVIGVRQRANCFNAVYRYVLPSGETHEATSLEGSDSVRGKQTGALVPLWVMPGKPAEVQEARNHIVTLIGAVLLVVAATLFYVAVTAWRVGPMTWIVAAVFLAHFAMRVRAIFFPSDPSLRPSASPFLARQPAAAIQAAPVRRIEDIASLPQQLAREARQRASIRRLAPFLLIAAVGLVGLGVHQSRALLRLETTGVRAPGTVTGLESSRSGNSAPVYYPLVTYTAGGGQTLRFKDTTGSNPPLYRVGASVTVLYRAGEAKTAIIDRGLWNWLPSLLLFVLGSLLGVVSIRILRHPGA